MPAKSKSKSDTTKSDQAKSSKSSSKAKDDKSDKTDKASSVQSSAFTDSSDNSLPPRTASLNLQLLGVPSVPGEYAFVALFNKVPIIDGRWSDGMEYGTDNVPMNLNDQRYQVLILSNPIIILLRVLGKATKEQDPLLSQENRAGGTVDLLPLLLGEEEIFTNVRLLTILTGEYFGCDVTVRITAPGTTDLKRIPLLLTMISVHCLPMVKEGTVFISAIGLQDIHKPKAVHFGQSLSTPEATKLVWATASNAGYGANTAYNVLEEDKFVPEDLYLEDTKECVSFYWNSINRVLVDVDELIDKLSSPFLIELAGVPKGSGKIDVRGRYMGWVDARALLEPGQLDVTVCTKLLYYTDAQAGSFGGLLELPPASAKATSARESDMLMDEKGHNAYAVIRFDLMDALVPKAKYVSLYDVIGFAPPEGANAPVDQLDNNVTPEDPIIDARFMRKSCGALAVHDELSNLTYQGPVQMNQGIKRSAANLLLMRVRTMLKNFPPGECSFIDWQDTVTGQHAAARRAVTSSFAPQPPPPRLPDRVAAARCRAVGDERLAQKHVMTSLKVAGTHPRSLICKTLRCLEERNDMDAKNYLFEALNSQTRNRYLLWILGAQEFDKGTEEAEVASAAFRIAVKGDYSDGTTNAIAWAALHTFHHCNGNVYGAHVAARKMRKSYLLPREWKKVLKCWTDASGEEEVLWNPGVISSENPILIAAAFFLCLRCFKFSEKLLQCVEKECATRGSIRVTYVESADVHYLRSAAYILKHQLDTALEITENGIKRHGPSALMSQMRLNCLAKMRSWDDECEKAFDEAEKAGAKILPSVLYKAALSRFKAIPRTSLQRAARAHKLAPSGHTALLIGRIYAVLGDDHLAERWYAGAVKTEPLLADGWAMLSILAMYERDLDKARTMLRTAKQVGPISPDIDKDLKKLMHIVQLDKLPDALVKDLCIKKVYDSDITGQK